MVIRPKQRREISFITEKDRFRLRKHSGPQITRAFHVAQQELRNFFLLFQQVLHRAQLHDPLHGNHPGKRGGRMGTVEAVKIIGKLVGVTNSGDNTNDAQ